MPGPRLHFLVAIPDASPDASQKASALDRLGETLASVAAQSGDFDITVLVDDRDGETGVAGRVPAWRAEAESRRGRGWPIDIVVSRHGALGDFDALDRLLADAPNSANAVVVPLRCGCRLAPGALRIVAGVLADDDGVAFVEGLAPAFGPGGVTTGLGFDPGGTWDAIGAASEGARDRRSPSGGLFWRADLWHRLGRMDPSLIYAGYLDFRSKAAVQARIARIEAVLVDDPRAALAAEHAGRQRAEIVRVKLRSARRQSRLHERMLDGEADFVALRPPYRAFYDVEKAAWRQRDLPPYLDPLGRAEIVSGFTGVVGPYPDAGLPRRFRWTDSRRAMFSVAAERGRYRMRLALRNPSVGQTVTVDLDGETLLTARPASASLHDLFEIDLICEFRQGRNDVTLTVDVMLAHGVERPLGLVVEGVDIVSAPP